MRSVLFAAALLLASPVLAEPDAPKPEKAATPGQSAAELLFEAPQMKNAAPGSSIRYAYLRRSGIAKGPYGPPIDDSITFKIDAGKDADSRDIQVQMFTGARRAPAGPFENMPANPIVSLFLENHLKGVAGLLEANPRYIKNAIRKGLRDKATITQTTIEFEGKSVEAWQVVTKPFEGDPQTARMRGFDTMTYTFVTSPAVPGEIVSIEATAKMPDGGELLEEKVKYDQNAG